MWLRNQRYQERQIWRQYTRHIQLFSGQFSIQNPSIISIAHAREGPSPIKSAELLHWISSASTSNFKQSSTSGPRSKWWERRKWLTQLQKIKEVKIYWTIPFFTKSECHLIWWFAFFNFWCSDKEGRQIYLNETGMYDNSPAGEMHQGKRRSGRGNSNRLLVGEGGGGRFEFHL